MIRHRGADTPPYRLPRRYVLRLVQEIAATTALILCGIEAVYLSDKVITDLLFTALTNRLGLLAFLRLIALSSPEVLVFGFPIAVTVAVYLALLRRREAAELQILAAAGVALERLLGVTVALGVAVAAMSLLLSGYVAPLAGHQFRLALYQTRQAALLSGDIAVGQVFDAGDLALVPLQGAGLPGPAARLLIYQAPGSDLFRATTVTDIAITPLPDKGAVAFLAHDARIKTFAAAPDPRQIEDLAVARLQLAEAALAQTAPPPRQARPESRTLPELLGSPVDDFAAQREFMLRLLRALFCGLGPVMALAALPLSRGFGLWLALPAVSLGLLLGAGVLGPMAAAPLAGLPRPLALALIAGAAVVVLLSLQRAMALGLRGVLKPEGLPL